MARIYIGNLPIDTRERDLEDLFFKYGRIRHVPDPLGFSPFFVFSPHMVNAKICKRGNRNCSEPTCLLQSHAKTLHQRSLRRDIELKTPSRPPAYAFISFEHELDAEDAIRGRDGVDFDGSRLRVEMSRLSDHGRSFDRYEDRFVMAHLEPALSFSTCVRLIFLECRRPVRPPPRDLRRSEFRVIISNLPPSCSWQDLKDFMRQAGDVIYTDGVSYFKQRRHLVIPVFQLPS